MRKIIIGTIILTIFALQGHGQEKEIRFEQGLSWQQVLAKAKAEHKYIFVDCYATWCVPCKWMDANVYNKGDVGEVYNKEFIAVRLQMDKTKADNDSIKKWYGTAGMIETNYHVNAYPTFLFFDPDGKPVHKVTGSMDAAAFIRLAKDAQNPDKQYYAILQNFQPDKLDTAEEKGLARSFRSSDKALAGKIAADYLNRIPVAQLGLKDAQKLMLQFQDEPDIDDLAVRYIIKLTKEDFDKEDNLQFAVYFIKDLRVQQFADHYISLLSENELLTRLNLEFIAALTKNTTSKNFPIFYHNSRRIDSVMKQKGYAGQIISNAIQTSLFNPVFETAKATLRTPAFDSLKQVITQRYNAGYADMVMVNSRLQWYSYLARDKKMAQYWPDYITARIAQVQRFRYDTTATLATTMNGICWDIFQHGSDKMQLDTVAGWMKNLAGLNANSPVLYAYLDTYANLLYKAGNVQEALAWEKKAAALAPKNKDIQGDYQKMQAGLPTWPVGTTQ
jgi:thioredoxin-related protein